MYFVLYYIRWGKDQTNLHACAFMANFFPLLHITKFIVILFNAV